MLDQQVAEAVPLRSTDAAADEGEFRELMRRVRTGDEDAASELVRRYGPVVRGAVRVHLRDSRLRHYFDSMDLVQSVLRNLFTCATVVPSEQKPPRKLVTILTELECPQQLVKLLIKMAEYAFKNRIRKEKHHLTEAGDSALRLVADERPDARPSEVVARKELAQKVRESLSDSVRRLADQWAAGRSWADIARSEGGAPDNLRVKFHRGLDKARVHWARDEADHVPHRSTT
jgi:DNA-directed RNA polymerase specialized sigma24 family protein